MADVFVYRQGEAEQKVFYGRPKMVKVPVGMGHIFVEDGLGRPNPTSLCGMRTSEIGDKTVTRSHREVDLPLCPDCQTMWKKRPDSPWAKCVGA